MALTFKEAELINFGVSIATGCKACTTYHFQKVKEAGASDEEIKNAVAYSVSIRDAAKQEMEKHALNLLGTAPQSGVDEDNLTPNRTKVLVSIGSAFAVNCTSTLNDYIAQSESVGITSEDIKIIFRTTLLIKRKASSHVDRIAVRFEEQNGESNDCDCGQGESNEQIEMHKFDVSVDKPCC